MVKEAIDRTSPLDAPAPTEEHSTSLAAGQVQMIRRPPIAVGGKACGTCGCPPLPLGSLSAKVQNPASLTPDIADLPQNEPPER